MHTRWMLRSKNAHRQNWPHSEKTYWRLNASTITFFGKEACRSPLQHHSGPTYRLCLCVVWQETENFTKTGNEGQRVVRQHQTTVRTIVSCCFGHRRVSNKMTVAQQVWQHKQTGVEWRTDVCCTILRPQQRGKKTTWWNAPNFGL